MTQDNNGRSFGAETTTDEVLDGVDLSGKTILVTGGTSGLGKESARALAARGGHIIVTARDLDKAQQVVKEIQQSTGATIEVEQLELGSFASIRACAERLLARAEKIDILLNNAGVMACPYMQTEDGFELQFGANHLGHFLLTCLIAPQIAEGGRVVCLSSTGHQLSPVDFDDIGFEARDYNSWIAYGQSKTANALFAVGLNARLAARGIEAFSVHPGVIQTELSRHLTEEDVERFTVAIESGGLTVKTVEQGAATQVFAATAPELSGEGGAYLSNCVICPIDDEAQSDEVVRSYAVDVRLADKLWRISEEMVGQSFSF